MELALNRDHLSCYDTVLDATVLHEETMEMIVPDACPDILRIVDTAGTVCLKSKEAQEGRVEISGTVRCAVLYLPDGETGVRRIEVNIPFFCSADGTGVAPGCGVVAVPSVQAAETRSINPRKVLVRVNLAVAVRAYRSADTAFCTGAEDDSAVEQLRESRSAYMVACVQEKPFTFSDDLTISGSRPEAEELLKSSVELICNESKIIGNKLIFKGEAALKLLYRSSDGAIASTDYELPFSQIMEVSGVEEEADCALDVLLTDLSCSLGAGDGRTVSVSLGLLAQAVVREERSVELLTDIYSVSSELTTELQSYTMNRLLEQNTRRQAAREVIETGVLAKSTLDTYVNLGAVSQIREGEKLTFSADAVVTVVYLAEDDEIYSVSRQIAVPCQADVPEGCTCTCGCRNAGEAFATPTTGGIEVRFELDFHYMVQSTQRVTGVCGVQVNEAPVEEKGPSIVLRAVAAERLWDIAKSYRTTTADIMQAIELESEEGLSGKLLLIPRKR